MVLWHQSGWCLLEFGSVQFRGLRFVSLVFSAAIGHVLKPDFVQSSGAFLDIIDTKWPQKVVLEPRRNFPIEVVVVLVRGKSRRTNARALLALR